MESPTVLRMPSSFCFASSQRFLAIRSRASKSMTGALFTPTASRN